MKSRLERYLIIFCICLIPLRVIGHGFLPRDDAKRHAAKVVSGKDWHEILVLRDDIKLDSHIGWHAILRIVHKFTNWDAHYLVLFSVFILFVSFSIPPILLLKRPEAWLITLLIITVADSSFIQRLFLGRPYIITMASLFTVFLSWPKLHAKRPPYAILTVLTLLIAASTWIHCSWYLLALPVLCFFLAREWRAGTLIAVCAVIGILVGALLTGHPYLFFKQTLLHAIRAFSGVEFQHMLATEFQPFTGSFSLVIVIFGMLAWRKIRGSWNNKVVDNPIFILIVISWILGFISRRFWLDYGLTATAAWIALEFQEAISSKIEFVSQKRLILTIVAIVALYLGLTNDADNRWTKSLYIEYLSLDNPEHASWLPDPGGTIYNDHMYIFYNTFFRNPKGHWRYILGFEPGMMSPEDLAIFRRLQQTFGVYKAYEPWVKKMKPEDRLMIKRPFTSVPRISGLEWGYIVKDIWVGRKMKKSF